MNIYACIYVYTYVWLHSDGSIETRDGTCPKACNLIYMYRRRVQIAWFNSDGSIETRPETCTTYEYKYVKIYMYLHIYTHIYMYIYVCIYTHMHMYICI